MRSTPLLDPAFLATAAAVLVGLVVLGALFDRPGDGRRSWPAWTRRVAIVLVLAAIGLRPGWGTELEPAPPYNLEVLVVMDRTASMSALDGPQGARLDGARADVASLVSLLPTARISLTTVGATSATQLPSTRDQTLLEESVADVRAEVPELGSGSRLDRVLPALQTWSSRLRDHFPERHAVVVLISDGEQTTPGRLASFAQLSGRIDDGLVLGFGSREGARIPVADDPGAWYVDPRTGQAAVTRLQEQSLRRVAEQLEIDYVHRTTTDPAALAEPAATWARDAAEGEPATGPDAPVRRELTWLLALLLLALAAGELRGHWRHALEAGRALR